jgi:tetratricopeptide (TPR) repeat protein
MFGTSIRSTTGEEKATRCVNLLVVHRGRFGHDAPDAAREYLGLLMQLGHISVEAKKYKTAREAWLECIELEGDDPITTARESLMRMYLDLKRYDAAYRLGERLADDPSVWIRYSYAVMALQQKKPDAEVEKCMVRAIQSNPFCAYYLAFYDTFNGVMEYTEDLAESEDEPQSSLEEAIECVPGNSTHVARFEGEFDVGNILSAARKLSTETDRPR